MGKTLLLAACLYLAGCASWVKPQQWPGPTSAKEELAQCVQQTPVPQSLRQEANYRQLIVSLESGSDAPTKLSQGDLQIRDGNQDVPVVFFQQEAASVGVLVDTSGSMESKMIQAKTTLTALIDDFNPDDQAFLMAFSSRPFILQPFTNNHVELKDRLDLLHAFGQTLLRDSVIRALKLVSHGCNQNKALFVMTDGMDNTSSANASDMLAAVKQSRVPIFSLGIGNKQARPLFMGRSMIGGDEDRVDAATLQALAEASGGKWYVLPTLGDAQAKQTASAIANEIDNEYMIGFIAPPARNSKIQIEILNHPGATIRIEGEPSDIEVTNASHS